MKRDEQNPPWQRLREMVPDAIKALQDIAASCPDPKLQAKARRELKKRGIPLASEKRD